MNEPSTYTAKDIERYHNGDLSAAEMHRLEKAALNDPMLADALEGYSFTKSAATDLQTLQSRQQQRIGRNKNRKLLFIGNTWLKIAALFVIIAGGGWLVFRTLSNGDKKMATSQRSESIQPAVGVTTTGTDSITTTLQQQNGFSNTDSGQVPDRTSVAKNDRRVDNRYEISTNATATTPPEKEAANDLNYPPPQNEAKQMNVTQAPVTNEVYAYKMKEEKADSNAVAKRDEVREQGRISGDSVSNVNIVMKKLDGPPLNEVVLSKRKQPTANRRMSVVVDTLEPAQGWSNFDDYIAGNINSPEELKDKRISSGEVELSFDVDNEGNAVNITVTKSLCDKCDKEAIRLLKEGPKWKAKTMKGKVKVKFPLSR